MLVLSRREQQTIIIGDPGPDQITVTVVRISDNRVRIGIDAPRRMPVVRPEAWRKEPRREGAGEKA